MARELASKQRDLGGFSVRRILPHAEKTMVGPFIFFDHMGPAEFAPGQGINVRPHPHIGLATVTYLYEGSILHRDSLGNVQEIFPGDVNWMVAGRGIVHSERESLEVRSAAHRANGFQAWLALPPQLERCEPSFHHHPRDTLPHVLRDGVMMRLIAGSAYGRVSPVRTASPMFYLDAVANRGSVIPRPEPGQEAAVYVQQGAVEVSGQRHPAGVFLLLEDGDDELLAVEDARLLLLGGAHFDVVPHIDWNFVAYDQGLIEAARERWRTGGFPPVPGDEDESIPLP